jgi:hypothetical protein
VGIVRGAQSAHALQRAEEYSARDAQELRACALETAGRGAGGAGADLFHARRLVSRGPAAYAFFGAGGVSF